MLLPVKSRSPDGNFRCQLKAACLRSTFRHRSANRKLNNQTFGNRKCRNRKFRTGSSSLHALTDIASVCVLEKIQGSSVIHPTGASGCRVISSEFLVPPTLREGQVTWGWGTQGTTGGITQGTWAPSHVLRDFNHSSVPRTTNRGHCAESQ